MASWGGQATGLDGSHPEEQGLKLDERVGHQQRDLLDGSHPEEQGLKHDGNRLDLVGHLLDGSHPEEQGLKLVQVHVHAQLVALMGVIQKNKD